MKLNLSKLLPFLSCFISLTFLTCTSKEPYIYQKKYYLKGYKEEAKNFFNMQDLRFNNCRVTYSADSTLIGYSSNQIVEGFYILKDGLDTIGTNVFYKRVFDNEIGNHATDEIVTIDAHGRTVIKNSFYISLNDIVLYKYYLKSRNNILLQAKLNFPYLSIEYFAILNKDTLQKGTLKTEKNEIK